MSEELFRVEILEPRKAVANLDCARLSLPLMEGELTLLARHATMLSQMKAGVIKVYDGELKLKSSYFVSGGFFSFADNKALISAEVIQTAAQIDPHKALEAEKRAMDRLDKRQEEVDVARALAALARARARKALLDLQNQQSH